MLPFKNVVYSNQVVEQAIKLKIEKQFAKTLKYLVDGELQKIQFKKRMPKNLGVYQFRINRQYRAICQIQKDICEIVKIYDHQN